MNILDRIEKRIKWETRQHKENWHGQASAWYLEDIPALLAVVRAVLDFQHSMQNSDDEEYRQEGAICPACGYNVFVKHKADCPLAALLVEVPE